MRVVVAASFHLASVVDDEIHLDPAIRHVSAFAALLDRLPVPASPAALGCRVAGDGAGRVRRRPGVAGAKVGEREQLALRGRRLAGLGGTSPVADDSTPDDLEVDELVVDEFVVEEISIDGMCGVY